MRGFVVRFFTCKKVQECRVEILSLHVCHEPVQNQTNMSPRFGVGSCHMSHGHLS